MKGAALHEEADTGVLPTGIQELDLLLSGGVPRGKITEIVGTFSSGKTGLTFSILTQATARGELVAYIDPTASLDPAFAQKAGIDLRHLLWVRGAFEMGKALKAADILVRAGSFGTVVLDLETWTRNTGQRAIRKMSFHVWFRLQRVIRGTPTVLLLLGNKAVTGSASALVISLQRRAAQWCATAEDTQTGRSCPKHAHFLQGISSQAELLQGKDLNHATFHCHF